MIADCGGSGPSSSGGATRRCTSAAQAAASSAARCSHAASTRLPASSWCSASSATRASATTGRPLCFAASNDVTLMLTKRTPGSWNADFDAVVKSLQRVPTPITTSASRASRLAAAVPVAPTAPRLSGWSETSAPRPACVSQTGMPVASTSSRSSAVASP